MRLLFLIALLVGSIVGTASAHSPRIALIITNADYPKEIGRLVKTHDDGQIIAMALEDVGFTDVRHVRDADFQTMRLEMANFVERIEKAGPDTVIFFYYSGHGAADRVARGENYLIPTKAKITTAKQLPVLGYGLSELVKALERVPAKARFVVIDACRDVAFTRGLKNAAKGFTPMRRLDGILIAFATRPGEVAQDEGIYSRELAKYIRQPGLPPERVFKLTQISVAEKSKGSQVPWIEDGLLVRGFQFKAGSQVASVAPAVRPTAQQRATSSDEVLSSQTVALSLQRELKRVGCYKGEIDGDWGPDSKKAMERFNTAKGLDLSSASPTEAALQVSRGSKPFICQITKPDLKLKGANRFDGYWKMDRFAAPMCKVRRSTEYLRFADGNIAGLYKGKGRISKDGSFRMTAHLSWNGQKFQRYFSGKIRGGSGRGTFRQSRWNCHGTIRLTKQ